MKIAKAQLNTLTDLIVMKTQPKRGGKHPQGLQTAGTQNFNIDYLHARTFSYLLRENFCSKIPMNQPKVHSYGSLRPVKSTRIAEKATGTQEHEEENVESTMPNTNSYVDC